MLYNNNHFGLEIMATKFQEIAGHLTCVVQDFSKTIPLAGKKCAVELVRNLMAHGDAREGKLRGKLANGVGSQYSHAISERGISSITQPDAHTSAASS